MRVVCESHHASFSTICLVMQKSGTPKYLGSSSKLVRVIHRFAGYDCEDPRDKIYGLLGLVDDASDLSIDYARLPQQVFMDAVLVMLT